MAVEHVDTGAEAVERPQAVEAPPPPPPDRPGAEDFPSRAESRAAASAAFDQSRQNDEATEARPDTSASESAAEDQDASHEDRTESSPAQERDELDARDGDAWDSPTGIDHDPADEGEQQPLSENAFHSETAADEHAPAQTESLDHRTPPSSEDADTRDRPVALDAPAETADDQRPDDLGSPADIPVVVPEEARVEAEGGVRAADAGVEQAADAPWTDPAPEIEQETRPPGDSLDASAAADARPDTEPDPDDPVRDSNATGQMTGAEEAAGAPGEEDRWDAEFTVGNKLVRVRDDLESFLPHDRPYELADPTDRADATSSGRFDERDDGAAEHAPQPPDPPTGKELPEMEGDDESRVDRLRRKAYERFDDLLDVTEEVAKKADGIFRRPPTDSHAVVRPDHAVMEAPHQGIHVGETATTLLATGIVVVELSRWTYGKMGSKERV